MNKSSTTELHGLDSILKSREFDNLQLGLDEDLGELVQHPIAHSNYVNLPSVMLQSTSNLENSNLNLFWPSSYLATSSVCKQQQTGYSSDPKQANQRAYANLGYGPALNQTGNQYDGSFVTHSQPPLLLPSSSLPSSTSFTNYRHSYTPDPCLFLDLNNSNDPHYQSMMIGRIGSTVNGSSLFQTNSNYPINYSDYLISGFNYGSSIPDEVCVCVCHIGDFLFIF